MKTALIEAITQHIPEVVTFVVTAGLAWIKRKMDISALKKNPDKINDL